MLRSAVFLLLTASACAHAPRAAAGPTSAEAPRSAQPACLLPMQAPGSDLIREHGTLVDPYQREGGVWLEGAPVLVNEDFDFRLAMAMEGGLGAGLAAAKRKEHNAQKAAVLAAITAPPELRERLDALRCCGVHVYFLLWGEGSAVLRTVADVAGEMDASRVMESAALPLGGDTGWAAQGVLLREAEQAVAAIGCAPNGAQAGAAKNGQ